jgi:hypothetical protein
MIQLLLRLSCLGLCAGMLVGCSGDSDFAEVDDPEPADDVSVSPPPLPDDGFSHDERRPPRVVDFAGKRVSPPQPGWPPAPMAAPRNSPAPRQPPDPPAPDLARGAGER